MPDYATVNPIETVARFTSSAPTDLYGLAVAFGLEVETVALPPQISGSIRKIWFGTRFEIRLNQAHSRTRQRFTLAHEIGHFVLHRDRIGDGIQDDELYRSGQSDEIEREANSYAASILMPAPLVRQHYRTEKSFPGIARIFDVSTEVARIRLKELRLG